MSEVIDTRYPIGRFSAPTTSGPEIRAVHMQTIRLLPERLQAAVKGLNDAQLDTPYREGGWTVRQLVHHVADSHAMSYTRFKLALTEDWPTIKPYNEAAWAELADSKLPIDDSIAMLEALHDRWVALLESMSEEDFKKFTFTHAAQLYGADPRAFAGTVVEDAVRRVLADADADATATATPTEV